MRRIAKAFREIGRIPSRVTALERNIRKILSIVESHQRETRLVLGQISLPDAELWRGKPPEIDGGPGVRVFERAAMCRQDSFDQPYFSFWSRRLNEPLRYHRKLWEFVFIAQAAWERGLCAPGRRGLGFGVGAEPLAAFFASQGVAVTATDMAPDAVASTGWALTNQHAPGRETLRKPKVCPDPLFEQNVEFLECDMNAISPDLTGYDFCWSACALEHLGSIENGLSFIEKSLNCLSPGGWAIHTTEFNISSNDRTVDNDGTVLFRRRDLEDISARLKSKGHFVAEIDWSAGDDLIDQYLDLPPYREEPHLKFALAGFRTTSIGFIVRKAHAVLLCMATSLVGFGFDPILI